MTQSHSQEMSTPQRRRLPDERESITHKFDIQGHEGYITVGLYPDGTPGEIFLTLAREGSMLSGFADAFATAVSYALQYGAPLEDLVEKFSHVRFEPSGKTRTPEVPFAKSIVDYVFRWLGLKFLKPADVPDLRLVESVADVGRDDAELEALPRINTADAPPCTTCGTIMVRSGACWKCPNCESFQGCV